MNIINVKLHFGGWQSAEANGQTILHCKGGSYPNVLPMKANFLASNSKELLFVKDIIDLQLRSNGICAWVGQSLTHLVFAVDDIRSQPSFYGCVSGSLRWYFIECGALAWRQACATESSKQHQEQASGWNCAAHCQHWLTAKSLKEKAIWVERILYRAVSQIICDGVSLSSASLDCDYMDSASKPSNQSESNWLLFGAIFAYTTHLESQSSFCFGQGMPGKQR